MLNYQRVSKIQKCSPKNAQRHVGPLIVGILRKGVAAAAAAHQTHRGENEAFDAARAASDGGVLGAHRAKVRSLWDLTS